MTRVAPALSSTLAGIEAAAAAVRIMDSGPKKVVLFSALTRRATYPAVRPGSEPPSARAPAFWFEAATKSDANGSGCPFHVVCESRMDAPAENLSRALQQSR